MTQSKDKYATYASDFAAMEEARSATELAWLSELRGTAWSRFIEVGMPVERRGNEKWKYTNVAPIANLNFRHRTDLDPDDYITREDVVSNCPWDNEWVNLVCIDGRYSDSLSNRLMGNGIYAGGLENVPESHTEILRAHLGQYLSADDDSFSALNTAFLHDGVFITVPEDVAVPEILNVVFVSTGRGSPLVTYPRLLIVAERNSSFTVHESYVSLSEEVGFTNAVSEIVLADGAQVQHSRLLIENELAYHVGISRVYQSEYSEFTSCSFTRGAKLGRSDLHVLIDGPEAKCNLNGLYLTSGSQHMDNFINIEHAKPSGTSRLLYKGILDGQSRAVFGGTVLVHKDAQHTDAQQTDKNLLLSEDAEVDSKPSLFIYADDVKCGHGATAGHIDAETLFYMRSRGLDLETAGRILIQAYAGEIIDKVSSDGLRDYLDRLYSGAVESPGIALRGIS